MSGAKARRSYGSATRIWNKKTQDTDAFVFSVGMMGWFFRWSVVLDVNLFSIWKWRTL